MSKEIEPIQQVEQRRDRVSQVLGEREALVGRIGTGAVKVGSSFENTLKVGRVRSKVRASVNRLTGELGQLNQELDAYGQARDYLGQISLRQTQLAEMSEMVAEGNLPQDVLQTHQEQYEEIASLPERNPALQRGIERIRREEEARKREQGIEAAPAPTQPVFGASRRIEPEEVVIQPRVEVAPIAPVTPAKIEPDEGKRGSERFRLPTGEELGGKIGELLTVIAQASPDSPMTSDQIAEALWPGVDWRVSSKRLGYVMFNARQRAAQAGIEVVGVHPEKRGTGDKGSYYLRTSDQQPQPIQVQPEATIASDFRFEGEEESISGEAAKLLQKLTPFDTHHIVTYQDLLREVSADDPQTLHQYMEEVRGLVHTRKLRLAYVPNPRDPRNVGYYIEAIRKPKVQITLLGDVVQHGKQRVKLSEEQYKLMWALAARREDPAFDNDLSERAFNEPNPEASPLSQVAAALNGQLTVLTGAEGIVVSGGDEQFGQWHKIKDARIIRKPGYLPVHSTRLEALHLLFQDASKQDVIRTLGVTRGRKRASHALTDPQAMMALSRAVMRLTNRANENITSDPETDTYLEMSEYMEKHKLADGKALVAHLSQKLGVANNPVTLQEVVDAETSEDDGTGSEVHYIDEGQKSAEVPEFGLLSRTDITMIGAAINMYRHVLEPILEQRGVLLIERPIIDELMELRGDEPIADFDRMTKAERDRFVNDYRIRALEKAREIVDDPGFDQTSEEIYAQNPNVWCLLVNLSEMNKVRVMNTTGIKEGITFLKDLLANPEARRHGFKVVEEPQPTPPAPEPRRVDVASLQAETVVLFDAQAATPQAEVEIAEAEVVEIQAATTPAVEEPPVMIVPIVPPSPVAPRVPEPEPKPKQLEVRDPDVRARVNQYLDQILEHPEFNAPASPGMVTRAFPRLKERTVDGYVDARYISTEQGRKANQDRFDPTGIAAMLYLYDHGDNLTGRLRKQVQEIVTEEIKKRQKRK